MKRDNKLIQPKPLNTAQPQVSKTYRKPQVYVVGKTASLIRGDYGKKEDNYRRYQD